MTLKSKEPCGSPGCLEAFPCPICDRVAGKYISLGIGKYESELTYIERVLQALMKNMSIAGITLAFRTKYGTDVLTSVGTPPHLVVADEETWDEFIR